MSNLWLYLRFQAMALVIGIVGPIFLMVYFGAQPDLTLKWMYYAGLVITAVDILAALTATDVALRSRQAAVGRGSGNDE